MLQIIKSMHQADFSQWRLLAQIIHPKHNFNSQTGREQSVSDSHLIHTGSDHGIHFGLKWPILSHDFKTSGLENFITNELLEAIQLTVSTLFSDIKARKQRDKSSRSDFLADMSCLPGTERPNDFLSQPEKSLIQSVKLLDTRQLGIEKSWFMIEDCIVLGSKMFRQVLKWILGALRLREACWMMIKERLTTLTILLWFRSKLQSDECLKLI